MASVAILIDDGRAEVLKGRVPGGVLQAFSQVAVEKGVSQGLILINSDSTHPSLRFKGIVDASACQRFRNVWFSQSQWRKTRV